MRRVVYDADNDNGVKETLRWRPERPIAAGCTVQTGHWHRAGRVDVERAWASTMFIRSSFLATLQPAISECRSGDESEELDGYGIWNREGSDISDIESPRVGVGSDRISGGKKSGR